MREKIKQYFRDTIWNFHLREMRGWKYFHYKWTRIVYLSLRNFAQHHCAVSASSLTYYTLMSVVPLLAMWFAVSRGFGYHELLRAELLQRFQDQNVALVELFKYADKFLQETQGGLIAGLGLLILFWSVTFLLSNLESVLNRIWGVKRLRSWKRIFTDYFAIMLIAPIFYVLASSTSIFVVDHLAVVIRELPLGGYFLLVLVNLIPYSLFWILFIFIYIFMPNTKVHLSSAAIGGLIASCLYLGLQWAYIYFQIGVTQYNAIFGSMAALPLFLIWVQLSWFVLLLGAEISCAHQTVEEHEFEGRAARASLSFKRLLTLWILHLSLKGFITREMLLQRYQIPAGLALPILEELVHCHLLHPTRGGYVPAQEVPDLRLSDVMVILDNKGDNDFPFIESKALAPFERALEHFRKAIETSHENKPLKNVPHTL